MNFMTGSWLVGIGFFAYIYDALGWDGRERLDYTIPFVWNKRGNVGASQVKSSKVEISVEKDSQNQKRFFFCTYFTIHRIDPIDLLCLCVTVSPGGTSFGMNLVSDRLYIVRVLSAHPR